MDHKKPQNQDIYQWDHYSDQPHIIRDKTAKRRMYMAGIQGSISTSLLSCFITPLAWVQKKLDRKYTLPANVSNIGLCVNIETELSEKNIVPTQVLKQTVDELFVDNILIRVPLSNIDNLQPYLDLAHIFSKKKLLIDILQDREHITDLKKCEESLKKIFTAFLPYTHQFKIGNAINRRKWAFLSPYEYFDFYAIAQQLRDKKFKTIELIGGGIIDFELPNFIRNLFHWRNIHYDAIAALLYVDRRGSPENQQFGANLIDKINWFSAIIKISKKTSNRFIITETNWPLVGTEPFAPAVGSCMVDENKQAAYLARYYLLAFSSGKIESIYWHQLVAPGYGLIDNREKTPRKRKAYYAFKTINNLFNKATVTHFLQSNGFYALNARNDKKNITAVWANDQNIPFTLKKLFTLNPSFTEDHIRIVSLTGEEVKTSKKSLTIGGDVIYFIQEICD